MDETSRSALDIEIESSISRNDKAGVIFSKRVHGLQEEKRAGPFLVPPGPSGDSSGEIFHRFQVEIFSGKACGIPPGFYSDFLAAEDAAVSTTASSMPAPSVSTHSM